MWYNYSRIADLNVEFVTKYSISHICRQFIIEKPETLDLTISATEGQIQEEALATEDKIGEPALEASCIYRNLCNQLWRFNGLVFHSAFFKVNDRGIALAAKSGTGKTTHLKLWKQILGDGLQIVNGDKPIIRLIDNKLIGFGTPWMGKETLGENSFCEVTDICFIERAQTNSVKKASADKVFNRIFNQILLPPDPTGKMVTLSLLDIILKKCNLWIISCNMELDAAKTAYDVLFKAEGKVE